VYRSPVAYGRLNAKQRKTLGRFVRGQIVHDFGAGDLELSHELLALGAKRVHAIDQIDRRVLAPVLGRHSTRISYKAAYFQDLPPTPTDILFLSWPINREVGLLPHILVASRVIYLGSNTGGSACGTPGIFEALVRRKLLAYVPDRKNSLVVAGAYLDVPREPTGEERAGLEMTHAYYSYENAEAGRMGARWT
jgi:hypothetical protein